MILWGVLGQLALQRDKETKISHTLLVLEKNIQKSPTHCGLKEKLSLETYCHHELLIENTLVTCDVNSSLLASSQTSSNQLSCDPKLYSNRPPNVENMY